MHWFDIDKLFPFLIEKLLNDNGTIAILSYYAQEICLDTELLGIDESFRNYLSNYENQFFAFIESKILNHIKEYLEFDCDNLKSGYKKYDFKKYFSFVEEHIFDV